MYKIPGRSIVCDTPLAWVREMIWVYVIMKIFKADIDAITCKCGSMQQELEFHDVVFKTQ